MHSKNAFGEGAGIRASFARIVYDDGAEHTHKAFCLLESEDGVHVELTSPCRKNIWGILLLSGIYGVSRLLNSERVCPIVGSFWLQ